MASDATLAIPTSRALALAASLRSRWGWAAVALSIAWVSWLRLGLTASGPDLDSDAYGHLVIGRVMLEQWSDVRIHWVWLPLWHVIGAITTRLGGGLDELRLLNCSLGAVTPVLLVLALRSHIARLPAPAERDEWLTRAEPAIPFVAGTLHALWPLFVIDGQSGEPEILFQFLVLGACLGWERSRFGWAALAGCCAVLLRYEGWVLPIAFGLLWLVARRERARSAMVWSLPAMVIVAWCVIHYVQTGESLQFLRLNAEFAARAHASFRAHFGSPGVMRSLAYYTVLIPWRDVSVLLGFMAPGALWMVRRGPRAHLVVLASVLAFVTYGWIRRSHLGLDRHFVAIVPLYATGIAAGLCIAMSRLIEQLGRSSRRRTMVMGIAVALVAGLLARNVTRRARQVQRDQTAAFLPDRHAADLLVAARHENESVFCDQARIEVFTRLAPASFVRVGLRAPHRDEVQHEIERNGSALIASRSDRIDPLRHLGTTLFDRGGIAVMRVDGTLMHSAAREPLDNGSEGRP